MKIENGKQVIVSYTVKVEGQVVESRDILKPLRYVQGDEQTLLAFQKELEGKCVGEGCQFVLEPAQAYGNVREEFFEEIPLSEMPPKEALQIGMTLHEKQPDGSVKMGRVKEIREETVLMDFNHPMAGQTLHYDVKVLRVE